MNQIIKNTIILFVITLVAGFCLGAVHDVTLEPIAQAQEAAATKTFQEVYRVLRQKGCFFLCDPAPMKMMKNDLSMLICR